MIELDGRTGEGGGQLVRIAVALAAVTGQALRISNVRGNRKGGGLKAQHVSAIAWLATATGATVQGLAVGSSTLVFQPGPGPGPRPPSSAAAPASLLGGADGYVVLRPATAAASTSLMLQAVLPYLVFRGGEPVPVVVHGGTHVSWAPSFDYLDQVLFPVLETWFGVRVERTLEVRGWSAGGTTTNLKDAGRVRLVVHPIIGGRDGLTPSMQALQAQTTTTTTTTTTIAAIDATILAPTEVHGLLSEALVQALGETPPTGTPTGTGTPPDLHLRTVEDSGHCGRIYVLLVARTAAGDDDGRPVRRWGRDYLGMENIRKRSDTDGGGGGRRRRRSSKSQSQSQSHRGGRGAKSGGSESGGGLPGLCGRIARQVVRGLADEVEGGGCGDSFLQDQVVVFQALAAGRTSFWREQERGRGIDEEEEKEEKEEKEKEEDAEMEAVQALTRLQLNERGEEDEDRDEDHETRDRTRTPFGQGSLHAQTARWVTAQMLAVRWFRGGTECEGVAWRGSGMDRERE